jgi:flagellar hook-basal body complex protein FliE
VTVAPLILDVPKPVNEAPTITPLTPDGSDAFGRLIDAANEVFSNAHRAEQRFISGAGGLQEMVVERTRADLALQIAAATTQRVVTGVQTLFGLQV